MTQRQPYTNRVRAEAVAHARARLNADLTSLDRERVKQARYYLPILLDLETRLREAAQRSAADDEARAQRGAP